MTEAAFWQTRQAAYAAGLERAAVIAEEHDDEPSNHSDTCAQCIATAIRAEKDKP